MDSGRERHDWLAPERLAELLDGLRVAGFDLGTAQYIAAQDLVLALVARGAELERPEALAGYLGPVVCSSPEEQAEFALHFDAWAQRFQPAPQPSPLPVEEEVEGLDRRSGLLLAVGLAVVLVAAGIAGYFFWSQEAAPVEEAVEEPMPPALDEQLPGGGPGVAVEEPLEVSSPAEEVEGEGWTAWVSLEVAAVASMLVLGAWWLWWRRSSRLFLERRQSREEPQLDQLWVRRLAGSLFPILTLHRVAQKLRRRRRVPSQQLDVDSTVERTLEAGGFPTPAYSTRLVSPEYLVLIDRSSRSDQQARFADELVDGLAQREVYVEKLYFDGDPRLCFPPDPRQPPVRLRELAGRYGEHRLLLFTDGAGLFDPLAGGWSVAADLLSRWQVRALLTFEPRSSWGQRERRLAERFLLAPARLEGLSELIGAIHAGRPEVQREVAVERRLPELLRQRPRRWLESAEPEPQVAEELLWELENYLGPEGMTWLAACAVYPSLDWNLTVYLGQRLEGAAGRPLLSEESIARLVRLPWLRLGVLPDWLRRRLVARLPAAAEHRVRAVLRALFLTALEPRRAGRPEHQFSLEYASRQPRPVGRLLRPMLRRYSRRASDDGPLKDFVFLTFLSGRQHTNLALRLPEAVGRILSRRRQGASLEMELDTPTVRTFWSSTVSAFERARLVERLPVGFAAGVGGLGLGILGSALGASSDLIALLVPMFAIAGLIAGNAWPRRLARVAVFGGLGALAGYVLAVLGNESVLDLSLAAGSMVLPAGALVRGTWSRRLAGPGLGLVVGLLVGGLLGAWFAIDEWEAASFMLFPLATTAAAVIARRGWVRLPPALVGALLGGGLGLVLMQQTSLASSDEVTASQLIAMMMGTGALVGTVVGWDLRGCLATLFGASVAAGLATLPLLLEPRSTDTEWSFLVLLIGALLGALLHAWWVWHHGGGGATAAAQRRGTWRALWRSTVSVWRRAELGSRLWVGGLVFFGGVTVGLIVSRLTDDEVVVGILSISVFSLCLLGLISGRSWLRRMPVVLLWGGVGFLLGWLLLLLGEENDPLVGGATLGWLTAFSGALAPSGWRRRLAGPGLGVAAGLSLGSLVGAVWGVEHWQAAPGLLFPFAAIAEAVVAWDWRQRLPSALGGAGVGGLVSWGFLATTSLGESTNDTRPLAIAVLVIAAGALSGAICGRDRVGLLSISLSGLGALSLGAWCFTVVWPQTELAGGMLSFLCLGALLGALLRAGYLWHRTMGPGSQVGEAASGETKQTPTDETGGPKIRRRKLLRRLAGCSAIAVVVLGLLAAILIPSFLDALQKAKQKRTMSDIRNMGTAWMSWLTDQVAAGAAGQGKNYDIEVLPRVLTVDEMRQMLVPDYISEVAVEDAWGHPLQFRMGENYLDPLVFSIRSPGRDGVYSGDTYEPGAFDSTDYDQDIVWADGYFVRWPEQGRS